MPENTSAKPATTEYAWVMTLQIPGHGGFQTFTAGGTYTVRPGVTRFQAYNELRAYMAEQKPGFEHGTVLFFSLEPNQL